MSEESTESKLRAEIDVVQWSWLWRHFAFGRVLVVRGEEDTEGDASEEAALADLVTAALAFTRDDKERVESWLESGWLGKPEDDEVREWDESGTLFHMLIVDPWVMVRPR